MNYSIFDDFGAGQLCFGDSSSEFLDESQTHYADESTPPPSLPSLPLPPALPNEQTATQKDDTHVSPSNGGNSTSRLRIVCIHCRNSHVSCDHERPCSRCRQKGLECVDAPKNKRGRKAKKLGTEANTDTNTTTNDIAAQNACPASEETSTPPQQYTFPNPTIGSLPSIPLCTPFAPNANPNVNVNPFATAPLPFSQPPSFPFCLPDPRPKPMPSLGNIGQMFVNTAQGSVPLLEPWYSSSLFPPSIAQIASPHALLSPKSTVSHEQYATMYPTSARDYVHSLRKLVDSRMSEVHNSSDEFLEQILSEYPGPVLKHMQNVSGAVSAGASHATLSTQGDSVGHDSSNGNSPLSSSQGGETFAQERQTSSTNRITQLPEIPLDFPVRDYVHSLIQVLVTTPLNWSLPDEDSEDGLSFRPTKIIKIGSPRIDPAEALSIICTRMVETISALPKLLRLVEFDVQRRWIQRLLKNVTIIDTKGPVQRKVVPLICIPVVKRSTRFFQCAIKGPECAEDEREMIETAMTMVNCGLIESDQAFPLVHMSVILYNIYERPTQFSVQVFRLLQDFLEDARHLVQLSESDARAIRNPVLRAMLVEDDD